MVYHLYAQICNRFKWGNREKAKEIASHSRLNCSCCSTSTASTSTNNMSTSESNYETQPQHKQSAGVAHVECTAAHNEHHCVNGNKQPAHTTDAYHRRQNQHTISTVNVYLIFVTLFICICTISTLLCTRIYQLNDVTQLRDNLTTEFVGRHDIEQIVRSILDDMENGGKEFRWVRFTTQFALKAFSFKYDRLEIK